MYGKGDGCKSLFGGQTAHCGGFCTTLRNGALSTCRSDVPQGHMSSVALILLGIESNSVSGRDVSQGTRSETVGCTCLFPCLNNRFSHGLITSETSDSYRITLMVTRVELLPNAPVRGV